MPKGSKKNLYKELALSCGIADETSARVFYYGFVRYVIQELKKEGMVILPELGTFEAKDSKARVYDINKGYTVETKTSKRVVFRPASRLKEYFKHYDIIKGDKK